MTDPEPLERLRDTFIHRLLELEPACEEGEVLTTGPLPYRRLDVAGQALAYLHLRPGRRAVRVDVTGRWPVRRDLPGAIPWAAGAASFWLRHERDVEAVARALARAIRDDALRAA